MGLWAVPSPPSPPGRQRRREPPQMGLCAQALAFPGTPVSSIRCAWKGRKITKSHWRSPLRGISSDRQRPDQDTEQHPGGHRVRPEGGRGVGWGWRSSGSLCPGAERSQRGGVRGRGVCGPGSLREVQAGRRGPLPRALGGLRFQNQGKSWGKKTLLTPPSPSPSLTPPDVSGGQGSF